MEEMRRIAFESVARACGFGSLGIFCFMVGLSFEPVIAFQSGGTLTLLMALVLVFKAYEARTKDHRRTEMWLYLSEESRPPQGLCPVGERHGPARNLFAIRAMDSRRCHRHVGARAAVFAGRPLIFQPPGQAAGFSPAQRAGSSGGAPSGEVGTVSPQGGVACASAFQAGLAQLVEHLICNQGVGGSSPSAGTRKSRVSCISSSQILALGRPWEDRE